MTRATIWAVFSIGAAAIHFAVMPEHLAEWWAFGVFFAVLAWFQALWAVGYLVRPSTTLTWLAIGINLATVVVWAFTRTIGLPFGPEPGMPEAVGASDVVATILEVALAAGLLLGSRHRAAADDVKPWPWPAILTVSALVAAVTTISLAFPGG
jgi:hypothetical protein